MLDNVREHDGRAFTYLAQHQPHLGVIQISLDVDPTRIKTIDRIVLFTDDNDDNVAWVTLEDNHTEQAIRCQDVPEKAFAIKLPAPAKGQAVRFNVDAFKTTYEFKLSSRKSPGESPPSQPPLSATELSDFQPEEISCTLCHRSLAVLRRDGKNGPLFRPLPSPHYQELIEAYLCHPSGEFAKKMDDVGEKGLWPDTVATTEGQREVILVGETELRLDAALVPDQLRGRMTKTSVSAASVPPLSLPSSRSGTKEGFESSHPLRVYGEKTDTSAPDQNYHKYEGRARTRRYHFVRVSSETMTLEVRRGLVSGKG